MQPHAWERPPRVVGHRGSPREAPENTMSSFHAALGAGARALELDVRLTRDLEVVVLHDPDLGRTVEGKGLVEDLDLADLQALDAGSWHGAAFAREPVPTLRAVLATLPPHVMLDVEMKPDAGNAHELPARVLALLQEHDALARCLVTSFDPELADDYARRAPAGAAAGMILPFEPDRDLLASFPRLRHLALAHEAATPDAMRIARDAGVTVHAWTVNDAPTARRLVEAGVASVITDRPRHLLEALPEAGPAA